MSELGYNTNLASEFYVLSALHRLGADAVLTLGNKKSVDIVVVRGPGDVVTVDVKGLAGKTAWPIDNVKVAVDNHYLVFVCYQGKIATLDFQPEVWVIPSAELHRVTYHAPGGLRVVQRSKLLAEAQQYHNAWELIAAKAQPLV
ncbi:MAG: hypothetical protein ACR2HN_13410 [Tepidiformaceae bacterium]